MKKILFTAVLACLLAPAATAGGWATVGLSSLPPSDVRAGGTWNVDVTVLQHGRTPLEGVQPTIALRSEDGDVAGPFAAAPTGEPGVYHAVVRFPAAGTWTYTVDDGFSQVHTYAPVTVGEPAVAQPETPKADAAPKPDIAPDVAPAAESPGSSTLVALVAVAVAFALAAGAMLALRRQRQPGAGV